VLAALAEAKQRDVEAMKRDLQARQRDVEVHRVYAIIIMWSPLCCKFTGVIEYLRNIYCILTFTKHPTVEGAAQHYPESFAVIDQIRNVHIIK
jgi:hypothetical protein